MYGNLTKTRLQTTSRRRVRHKRATRVVQTPGSRFEKRIPYLEKGSLFSTFCSFKYKEILNGCRERLYIAGPSTLILCSVPRFFPLTLTLGSFFQNFLSCFAQRLARRLVVPSCHFPVTFHSLTILSREQSSSHSSTEDLPKHVCGTPIFTWYCVDHLL